MTNSEITYPVDVAVVDKNPLVVRAIKSLFQEDGRFHMVASATDGERFLDAVGRVPFDVVISSWVMPYCSGRELLEKLRELQDAPRIIIYTGSTNPNVARDAMRLGAAGFCAKDEPPERLLQVLDAVVKGSMIFPFMDMSKLAADPLDSLTRREKELLGKLAIGLTNKELATELGVSTNTIKFHLRNLYSKLDVRNRAEAAALHVSVHVVA